MRGTARSSRPPSAAPPGANATVLSVDQEGALTVAFCQVFPVHFMLSGTRLVLESVPTAKAIAPGPAAMPDSSWNSPASGKLADAQLRPFQRSRKPSSWPTREPLAHDRARRGDGDAVQGGVAANLGG